MGRENEICGRAFGKEAVAVSTSMLVTLRDFLPPTLQAGGAPGGWFQPSSAALLREKEPENPK